MNSVGFEKEWLTFLDVYVRPQQEAVWLQILQKVWIPVMPSNVRRDVAMNKMRTINIQQPFMPHKSCCSVTLFMGIPKGHAWSLCLHERCHNRDRTIVESE